MIPLSRLIEKYPELYAEIWAKFDAEYRDLSLKTNRRMHYLYMNNYPAYIRRRLQVIKYFDGKMLGLVARRFEARYDNFSRLRLLILHPQQFARMLKEERRQNIANLIMYTLYFNTQSQLKEHLSSYVKSHFNSYESLLDRLDVCTRSEFQKMIGPIMNDTFTTNV